VLSLKGRALRYLSQREHSRAELARKLAPHAESDEQLQALLDQLGSEAWLSDARFAQSLAHRRAQRYGIRRIAAELATHGLQDSDQAAVLADLQQTEIQRASQCWARRFGQAPQSALERSKQQRFLLQRGFTSEVIRTVLQQASQTVSDPPS
jgi:regulatory protein